MAVTFQKAKELLRQISKKVTGSTNEWTSFLSASSKMYKYSFNDQLLIYAQNPKATACAAMQTWNKKLLHWIKSGSKGIALIKNNNGKAHLEYVFDISSTYALNKAKQPKIWSVSKNNYKYVLKKLEKEYGSLKGNNFTEKLMFLAESIVKQNYKDYVHNLLQTTKNTYLEELDTQNIEVIFRNTLIASVQYTILSRCGINADKYFENEDFKGITNFNTPAAFSYIGNVINNISKPVLQQIEHNVKVHDNRNIEKNSDIKYINNKDTEKIGVIENVGQVEKENNTINRGVRREISSRGRLSDTQHRNRGETVGNRQVGNKKNGILERKSANHVFDTTANTGIKPTSSRNRQAGNRENGNTNKTNGGTVQNQRGIESTRPNEVGTRNEQNKTNSRRNNTERNNLPTIEEQFEIIKAEESKTSAFFITKNDINNALKNISKDKTSKFKTFEYFQKATSIEKSIEFLKNEYKIGSQPFAFSNLVNGNIEISQSGFSLKTEDNLSGIYYSWIEVAKQIYNLVKNNNYLSSSEHIEYTDWKNKNDKELKNKELKDKSKIKTNKKSDTELNTNEFKILQEDIDKALIYMNRIKENKMRTYMRFQNKHTLKDDIEFLKNIYNQFKILFVFHDNSLGHMIFDNKKFVLTAGENKPKISIQLNDAVKRIRELISEDKFLSEDEKIKYQEWNKRRIEELNKEEENAEIIIKPLFSNEPETIIKLNDNKIKEIEQIEQQEAESKEEKGQIQNSENDNLQSETRLDEHEKTTLQENSKNVLEENQKSINKQNFDLVDVEDYAKLKVEYPNYVIGVQKDDSLILYGKDAENAAEYLNLNIETKDIKDLGKTSVICFPFSKWKNYGDILQDKGFNFVFANENKQKDSYKILSIQNAKPQEKDYTITIGTEFEYNKQKYKVTRIDDNNSLTARNIGYQSNLGGLNIIGETVFSVNFVMSLLDTHRVKQKFILTPETKIKINKIISNEKFSNLISEANTYLENNPNGENLDILLSKIYTKISDTIILNNEKTNIETTKHGISIETNHSIGTIYWQEIADFLHQEYKNNLIKENNIANEIPESAKDETNKNIADSVVDSISENTINKTILENNITNEIQAIDNTESKEINFIITNDDLGIGGQKTKYSFNVAAIKILKLIEAENRLATKEEQEILSKYVGWGGISQVFDSNNEKWSKEYKELKELVTDSEYEAIRKTTLSAYYTPPIVIKSIYTALEQTGFKTGKILEPSCGIGNFFGILPKEMNQSQLYGIELDDITGRIAKQLYQKANITISGYEKTQFPDNYFDVAIGNIPFGNYKVADSRYNKYNFSIHDYFFAKTIDQVKPNGVIAFVTTKGVLDKQNSKAREYIAQRADLLGAVRLPNNAFKQNAGTDVTTDIIFLKKRSKLLEKEQLPEWVHVGKNNENVPVNQYFLNNPQMLLGKMEFYKNMYGDENGTACIPFENAELSTQLETAINALNLPKIEPIGIDDIPELEELKEKMNGALPILDDNCKIRNLSYIFLWDKLYFRENNFFIPKKVSQKKLERLRELVKLRDITRELIEKQTDNVSDEEIKTLQGKLNKQYDDFTTKYGFINNAENRKIFDIDSSYPLLCSLEVLNDDKTKLERKADIFFKRTIKPHKAVTHVDTANEALIVSVREKACVDLKFMAELMGGIENIDKIKQDLQGIIFKNPLKGNDPLIGWETADKYLSGNVREKLKIACEASEKDPSYNINVIKLKQVQPKDLKVSDIEVRLGTEWIDLKYYQQFMYETFKTPNYDKNAIKLDFSEHSNKWYISKKKLHKNTLTTQKYGTEKYTAYEILEKTLNFKDIVVKRKEKDFEIIDADATEIVQQKQQDIQEAFKNWIWQDPTRRNELCKKYNELYNNIRPREYNGSHLHFQGMNKEYSLKPHQLNGVARILYGGNTLLAHVVGAGKTFTMIAAAMELKRLGLSSKPLIVVPNHIVGQWQSDFLTLYPNANILVASKKDFETKNRKKLFSRIALGNYDAVIIGHTQLEKIPISLERKKEVIQQQIDELENAIYESELAGNSEYSIKEMEYKKENLSANLEKLMDTKPKDDVIYFEQLGIDRIFIDEAHEFKNLFLYTKMQNVSGINTTSAMKSSDLYAKCRYIDEITDGKGIVFATGTPISNSITELYTMMKYLQHRLLEKTNLRNFDSWAAVFAGKKTAMEIKPEGKGFRLKTRFSHFFNLPELMKLWKECTDVQTADMLNLPRPTPEYINVVTKPTEIQKRMVQMLGKRADKIRAKKVGKAEDNMLNITNDGRKLALDQRVINPLLADEPDSKVSNCVENVYENWKNSTDILGTQLIFCDMSTPKSKSKNKEENNTKKESKNKETKNTNIENNNADENSKDLENENAETNNPLLEQEADERFCIYDDIKEKLIKKGIPKDEIAFIHDYDKESEKKELFEKVRSGKIRVLLGSTPKLGAGTNVQDRLVALHHLDCPWRPSDLEQREGRILRRGNMNKNVKIYRYITEGTFDAYNWSVIENKQHFISQVITSKTPLRSIEDVDATELSYAEVKALAAGDSRIKDIMTLETDIKKLKILKSNFYNEKYEIENKLIMYYPEELEKNKKRIENLISDLELSKNNITDKFVMEIENKTYTKKQEAGEKLIELTQANKKFDIEKPIGEYKGFKISLLTESGIPPKFSLVLNNQEKHYAELGTNPIGNIIRIDNVIETIPKVLNDVKNRISEIQKDMEISKEEVNKEFPKEKELEEKETHLDTLKKELDSIKTTENQEIDLKVVETKGNQKPSVLGKLNEFKQEINKDNKQQNSENKEQKKEVCI